MAETIPLFLHKKTGENEFDQLCPVRKRVDENGCTYLEFRYDGKVFCIW